MRLEVDLAVCGFQTAESGHDTTGFPDGQFLSGGTPRCG